MGKRTRAIERKLREVEALPAEDSNKILPLSDIDEDLESDTDNIDSL